MLAGGVAKLRGGHWSSIYVAYRTACRKGCEFQFQPLLKGYSDGIGDLQGKERFREKLQLIDGQDHV